MIAFAGSPVGLPVRPEGADPAEGADRPNRRSRPRRSDGWSRRNVRGKWPTFDCPGATAASAVVAGAVTSRSERMLIEQLDYTIRFRWFVGLTMDDVAWNHSTFPKNRDRLMRADIAGAFFSRVGDRAEYAKVTSDEHFTVDGTLIQAWALPKSVYPPTSVDHQQPEPLCLHSCDTAEARKKEPATAPFFQPLLCLRYSRQ